MPLIYQNRLFFGDLRKHNLKKFARNRQDRVREMSLKMLTPDMPRTPTPIKTNQEFLTLQSIAQNDER